MNEVFSQSSYIRPSSSNESSTSNFLQFHITSLSSIPQNHLHQTSELFNKDFYPQHPLDESNRYTSSPHLTHSPSNLI